MLYVSYEGAKIYSSQILLSPLASVTFFAFMRPYNKRRLNARSAVAKLHAAQVKLPVGYPLSFSPAIQIHCAMT